MASRGGDLALTINISREEMEDGEVIGIPDEVIMLHNTGAVSYTHLTLPTKA